MSESKSDSALLATAARLLADARSVLDEAIDGESRASRMYAGGVCPSRAADVLEEIDTFLEAMERGNAAHK